MKLKKREILFIVKGKNKKSEFGRSMVEMLGVIGVIGLLTLFGIFGYQYATGVYQAHTIIDTMTKVKALTATKQIKSDADLAFFMDKQLLTYQPQVIENTNPLQVDLNSVSYSVANHVLKTPKAPYTIKVKENNPNALSFIFDGIHLSDQGGCSDRCQAGETTTKTDCDTGQIAQKTNNTSCGNPCYKCVNNTCPNGTTKTPDCSVSRQQLVHTTPDGTNCFICLETCETDSDCNGTVCDTSTHTCVSCTLDKGCPQGKICELTYHECVECLNNSDCPSNKPICNSAIKECTSCPFGTNYNAITQSCENHTCSGNTPIYNPTTGTCVACLMNRDCDVNTPLCYLETHTCIQCLQESDCPIDKPLCDISKKTCITCPEKSPIYDALSKMCVECSTNKDCPSEKPQCTNNSCQSCSSQKPVWNITTGTCEACPIGTPLWDGSACKPCPIDKPIYDTTNNQCVECVEDINCDTDSPPYSCGIDDGDPDPILYPVKYTCQNNQCVETCTESRFCSCERPLCDTTQKRCLSCPSNKPYWNRKLQTCIECQTNADCSGSTPACNTTTGVCEACPGNTPYWDPITKTCSNTECQTNADCKTETKPFCKADKTCGCPDSSTYNNQWGSCSFDVTNLGFSRWGNQSDSGTLWDKTPDRLGMYEASYDVYFTGYVDDYLILSTDVVWGKQCVWRGNKCAKVISDMPTSEAQLGRVQGTVQNAYMARLPAGKRGTLYTYSYQGYIYCHSGGYANAPRVTLVYRK